MDTSSLNEKAKELIENVMSSYDEHWGFGSMSCAVYDSAWVSLITKEVNGQRIWLFPECFRYILDKQSEDGGWDGGPSDIDGILNTAASLLSLKRHASEPLQILDVDSADLAKRIQSATTKLDTQLNKWDVPATVHVGFEILVPCMLEQLENEGIKFYFPGMPVLSKINAAKMSRFRPEYLYGTTKLTALHSLEAFIGKIDFDRVVQHKEQGAMMASPSSTAAYLIHATKWDDEAEAYLRQTVSFGPGKGNGGVPSAYPSTFFEFTWILSTLLESGFSRSDLESPHLRAMLDVLEKAFKDQKGLLGFAQHVECDADDTAKAILSLNLLGAATSPDSLVGQFRAHDHFRTYAAERDPSFSANCNVLIALLHVPEARSYFGEIEKVVGFLCNRWWDCNGVLKDKWNLSQYYPLMLMVQAFADLLAMIDNEALPDMSDDQLRNKVAVALFQATMRTLLSQKENGSWNESREQTAYAVTLLAKVSRLSFVEIVELQIKSAIQQGRVYLKSAESQAADYIWIEKVTYASPFLAESYVLAAMKAPVEFDGPKTANGWTSSVPAAKAKGMVKFYRQTPLFSAIPDWQIAASLAEGYLFQPLLRQKRLSIFPREGMEEDKYFEYIPFTWTGCSNRKQAFAPTSFLHEMMIISFLNYQADEFMEAVAGIHYHKDTSALRALINEVFEPFQTAGAKRRKVSSQEESNGELNGNGSVKRSRTLKGCTNGTDVSNCYTNGRAIGDQSNNVTNGRSFKDDESSGILKVREPLVRLVNHIMTHPAVVNASAFDRGNVLRELKIFLLAHVSQTEDNARFGAQPDVETSVRANFETPTGTFFNWVRTISADHTSCPYSFAFVACLLGHGGRDCFQTAEEKYVAADVCRHLSAMCRMYNDFGSVARDRLEKNLNSINFPEFATVAGGCGDEEGAEGAAKDALFRLAEYERDCLTRSLARLDELAAGDPEKGRKMEIWRMFCDVTDLYGQIYVVRDIASRMIRANGEQK